MKFMEFVYFRRSLRRSNPRLLWSHGTDRFSTRPSCYCSSGFRTDVDAVSLLEFMLSSVLVLALLVLLEIAVRVQESLRSVFLEVSDSSELRRDDPDLKSFSNSPSQYPECLVDYLLDLKAHFTNKEDIPLPRPTEYKYESPQDYIEGFQLAMLPNYLPKYRTSSRLTHFKRRFNLKFIVHDWTQLR